MSRRTLHPTALLLVLALLLAVAPAAQAKLSPTHKAHAKVVLHKKKKAAAKKKKAKKVAKAGAAKAKATKVNVARAVAKAVAYAANSDSDRTKTPCAKDPQADLAAKLTNLQNVARTWVLNQTAANLQALYTAAYAYVDARDCAAAAPATPTTTTPVATAPSATTPAATTPAPAATTPATTPVVTTPATPTPAPAPTATTPTTTTPTASVPASTPVAGGGLTLGLMANSKGWGDGSYIQDKVAKTGVRWIREEFDWRVLEPQNGRFDYTHYDEVVANAAKRGIRVLPLLMDTPSWAGSSWSAIPSDPTNYADFVAHMTARYGQGGTFWTSHPELDGALATTHFELWNEPYYDWFSSNGIDPARYARLVKAAAIAGRAANANAKFLMEAVYDQYAGQSWTNLMYQAVPDLNKYFDAVAIHPYGIDQDSASDSFRRNMEDVRRDVVAHGGSDKPFWLTEIGWSTCSRGAAEGCTSEQGQAQLLSQTANLMKTKYASYVRMMFLYDLNDALGGSYPSDVQANYGFLHGDWSPKPAYTVLQKLTGVAS